MPLISGAKTSTNADGLQDTIQGIQYAPRGVIYRAWSYATAYHTSTTQTSVMPTYTQGATTLTGFGFRGLAGLQGSGGSKPGFFPGQLIHVKLTGTIANTGTPTLNTEIGLNTPAGTFLPLGETTAVAMTNVSTVPFDIDGYIEILSLTGSNNVRSWVEHTYNVTTVKSPRALFTVDLGYSDLTIDVQCTWGASSASNTMTLSGAFIEVI